MTTGNNGVKCLNALSLKLLAMVLMLFDHIWATIVPGATWMTSIGRLAFPIFAFQIAEGFSRTGNVGNYIRRMFLFAMISEIPYDIMMEGTAPIQGILRELCDLFRGGFSASYFSRALFGLMTHQNVMFTFLIALFLLKMLDGAKHRNKVLFAFMIPVSCMLGLVLGQLLFVDYHGEGVLMVLLFWLFRDLRFGWIGQLAGMAIINCSMIGGMTIPLQIFGMELQFPQQGFALLALVPIWMYNGKQGPHNRVIRYACYLFYPVHILVLSLIALNAV